MTSMRKKIALSVFAILILFLAVFVGPQAWELYRNWQTPLGPALALPTLSPTMVLSGSIKATSSTPLSASTLLPNPTPRCGGPSVMTILAIGSDTRADNYLYGLADVLRIVRVDFVNARVTVFSIERDLWVEIPEISDHYGITHGKLNQAYLYGNPGMGYYDGPGGGPGLLARTLDLNFGLRVDQYLAVNMQTFVKIVDALGGIEVYLDEPVDGTPLGNEPTPDGAPAAKWYFSAGQHHLGGEDALRLARVRKKYSVFKRADNQNIVLCAIREKALSVATLPKIPQIIAAFENAIQTDLTPQQISQLACLAPQISGENIIFASISNDLYQPSRVYDPMSKDTTFVWDIDFDIIRSYVSQFMEGTWPEPGSGEGESTCQ